MVLYFSATGNTEYSAKEIAQINNDESLDLLQKIRTSDYSEIKSEKPFVICAPVYVCELPDFMLNFLKKVTFSGSREVYFIFTSGGYSGRCCKQAKSLCRRKGLVYKGSADLKMPRNYIASDIYPMLSEEEMRSRISNARNVIKEIAETIKTGGILKMRHVYLLEDLIILIIVPFWRKFKLTAKDFYVQESCIGCGKCAKLCPLNNIEIENKKPVWGKKCTHCMACICNCPKDSIEYGKITEGKTRYQFKKYGG